MTTGITEPYDSQKKLIMNSPFDKENRSHAFIETDKEYTLWSLDDYIGYNRVYRNGAYPWKMYLKLRDVSSGEKILFNPILLLDSLIIANENQIIEPCGTINRSFREYINQNPFITQKGAIDFLAQLIGQKHFCATRGESFEAQKRADDPIYKQNLINLEFVSMEVAINKVDG